MQGRIKEPPFYVRKETLQTGHLRVDETACYPIVITTPLTKSQRRGEHQIENRKRRAWPFSYSSPFFSFWLRQTFRQRRGSLTQDFPCTE